jgi:hypothetical protein
MSLRLAQRTQDLWLWVKGNLSHRFQDTAVDFWLGAGCSMRRACADCGNNKKHTRTIDLIS